MAKERPGSTLTRTVLGACLALDVVFRALVPPTLLHAVGARSAAERFDVAVPFALASAVAVVVWLSAIAIWLGPIRRWHRARTDVDALTAAGVAIDRLPGRVSVSWAATWVTSAAVAALVHGFGASPPAVWLFLGALSLGPLPLAHSVCVWLLAPTRRELSGVARAHRAVVPAAATSLRRRLAAYSFALAVGPTFYMASFAYSAIAYGGARADLAISTALAFAAIGVYAMLCAAMLALTIVQPVHAMREVMAMIAQQGDVTRVGRVPQFQRDELGGLADSTNQMIDRLERTAIEGAAMSAALRELNATLEQRVEDRTALLRQANSALEQEMERRARAEISLRQAQKLESVGRLAAGVAHGINTPVQFVSDSTHFVRDSMVDVLAVLRAHRDLLARLIAGEPTDELVSRLAALEDDSDIDYLEEHVPMALTRSVDGLERIAAIVRSMKEFAHPDVHEKRFVDLNHAIESTLVIARHEYKRVADVETDFGELPPVLCHAGEINQVILNIVVNAAHAIGDVVGETGEKGRITVGTRAEGDDVVLAISDTGTGIPPEVLDRVFDPFFTTKEVGRGTGQGLAIAHHVVIETHGGRIELESTVGVGTTVRIRLPIAGAAAAARAA